MPKLQNRRGGTAGLAGAGGWETGSARTGGGDAGGVRGEGAGSDRLGARTWRSDEVVQLVCDVLDCVVDGGDLCQHDAYLWVKSVLPRELWFSVWGALSSSKIEDEGGRPETPPWECSVESHARSFFEPENVVVTKQQKSTCKSLVHQDLATLAATRTLVGTSQLERSVAGASPIQTPRRSTAAVTRSPVYYLDEDQPPCHSHSHSNWDDGNFGGGGGGSYAPSSSSARPRDRRDQRDRSGRRTRRDSNFDDPDLDLRHDHDRDRYRDEDPDLIDPTSNLDDEEGLEGRLRRGSYGQRDNFGEATLLPPKDEDEEGSSKGRKGTLAEYFQRRGSQAGESEADVRLDDEEDRGSLQRRRSEANQETRNRSSSLAKRRQSNAAGLRMEGLGGDPFSSEAKRLRDDPASASPPSPPPFPDNRGKPGYGVPLAPASIYNIHDDNESVSTIRNKDTQVMDHWLDQGVDEGTLTPFQVADWLRTLPVSKFEREAKKSLARRVLHYGVDGEEFYELLSSGKWAELDLQDEREAVTLLRLFRQRQQEGALAQAARNTALRNAAFRRKGAKVVA